jgi:hypothetical protein
MTLPAEVTAPHTRLLRLALGVDESRAYWLHGDPTRDKAAEAIQAFEERWFGASSLERVRVVLAYLRARYAGFPQALAVLRHWPNMAPATRQVLCHWHLQLNDPIYRRFTGEFLVARRDRPNATIDRPLVIRWVRETFPDRWGPATHVQFASKLLSAASEAGLVSPRMDPRTLLWPKVSDHALTYLLHLLRGVTFDGRLTDNPYLASVGLDPMFASDRIRALPDVTWNRQGDLDEFTWTHPDLLDWGRARGFLPAPEPIAEATA